MYKCVDMAKASQGDILYVIQTGPGEQEQTGDGFCRARLDDDSISKDIRNIEEKLLEKTLPVGVPRPVRRNECNEISIHRLKRSDYFHECGLLTCREDMKNHRHPPRKFSNMHLLLRDTGVVIVNGNYWVQWELDRISYNSGCLAVDDFTNSM